MVPPMTNDQTAKYALTDYRVEIVSQVIPPFQATAELPAHTRQWRCEMYHDIEQVEASDWTTSLQETTRAAETMLILKERELEVEAEKEAQVEYNDDLCNSCAGSGMGYTSDTTCWFCGGRGIALKETEESC